MTAISLRARSAGELLDGAFRLYRQDLGLYVLTAVLAALPMALFMVLSAAGAEPGTVSPTAVVGLFVGAIAYTLAWAALMHQMNERLEGREPAFGASVARALRVAVRVLWAGFITYLVFFGAMFVVIMVAAVAYGITAAFANELLAGVVAGIAALVLCFTLGVRVFAGATLFLPGIIAESLSGFASVKRGFALTKEGRWRVAAVISLAWVLIIIPMMAVYFVTGTTSMILDPEATARGTVGMGQLAVQQLLAMIGTGFTTPFLVACTLLLYYDQRVRLEAFDLETEAGALAE